jgi:hypothetical protein
LGGDVGFVREAAPHVKRLDLLFDRSEKGIPIDANDLALPLILT